MGDSKILQCPIGVLLGSSAGPRIAADPHQRAVLGIGSVSVICEIAGSASGAEEFLGDDVFQVGYAVVVGLFGIDSDKPVGYSAQMHADDIDIPVGDVRP